MAISAQHIGRSLTILLTLLLSSSWAAAPPANLQEVDLQLQQAVTGIGSQPQRVRNFLKLRGFYQARGYRRAWDDTLLPRLIAALNNSTDHGLTPCDYRVNLLEKEAIDPVQRELLATDAYLTLAGHLLFGKVDPVSITPSWSINGRRKDLVQHLAAALKHGEIEKSLEELSPRAPEYSTLKKSLSHYRKIAHLGGWGKIPPGGMLRLGDRNERVVQLRARLRKSGDLPQESPHQNPAEFTVALEEAVKKFQQRANLEVDGIVGPNSLRNLNKTPFDRINSLRINMERWRWLPEDLGRKHIRINVAGFYLETRQQGEEPRVHKVIVGLQYRQTPIFSAAINYLDFNPYWYAPRKLATRDKLPMFRADPDYFNRSGFELLDRNNQLVDARLIDWNDLSENYFPYLLRQRPGPENAMGQVKFIFPNPYHVYLHDTPSQELFAKARRVFSSGCIRVQDPLDLAQWLLTGQDDWDRGRIDELVEGGKTTRILLKKPVPIYLLYWTVLVDRETGELRFIDDSYQRDQRILQSLDIMCPTPE